MLPPTFSSQAIAERRNEIPIDKESYGLLNHVVRGFFLETLVQSGDGNVKMAAPFEVLMKELQDLFCQLLNLDRQLHTPIIRIERFLTLVAT